MIFENRTAAGKLLGQRLGQEPTDSPIVFGLARGGVITAAAVAKILKAPLDVVVVRKLASPLNPEFGFGAIAPLGTKVLDKDTLMMLGLSDDELEFIIDRQRQELERRARHYRFGRDYPELTNRTVILVDDGIATGVSMRAAVEFVRRLGARDIIVAAPVCATSSMSDLEDKLRVACLESPEYFLAVGEFYHSFEQASDNEVINILRAFK